MKNYPKNSVYFISYAKLPGSISAGKLHEVVGVGLVINYETGEVIDISCTLITEEAKFFLHSIIAGFNMHNDSIDELIGDITFRFHGMSQKAITVAVKGAYERYMSWRSDMKDEKKI